LSDNKYSGPFSGADSAQVWVAVISFGIIIAFFINPGRQDPHHDLPIALAEGYRDYRLKAFASDELPEFGPETSGEWTVFCENWPDQAGCDLLAEVGFPFARIEIEAQCKLEQEDINDGPERRLLYTEGLRGAWRQFDYSLEPATVCAAYGVELSN